MTERRKAWAALLAVLLLWCTPTIFVKFFMSYYDPFAQNFLRYASGMALMLPLLALQWLNPAFTSFLNKSSILFAAAMAYAFFPEERRLFRSRRFLVGVALAVLGTLGLSLLRADPQIRKLRYQQELTQDMLAARCARCGWDISRGTLSKVEAQPCCVTDSELLILARALRVSLDQVFPPKILSRQ